MWFVQIEKLNRILRYFIDFSVNSIEPQSKNKLRVSAMRMCNWIRIHNVYVDIFSPFEKSITIASIRDVKATYSNIGLSIWMESVFRAFHTFRVICTNDLLFHCFNWMWIFGENINSKWPSHQLTHSHRCENDRKMNNFVQNRIKKMVFARASYADQSMPDCTHALAQVNT